MKLINSEKGTFKSKIPFLYLAVVIAIIFTSYGYAALNTELSISGEAYVRVETDIRVTNIKILSSENKGYETYNNKYTKDTTSTFVTLPDSNSKLTYEIEITNDSNSRYYLSDILENSYSNKNIKYEIQDISVGDIIPSNTVKKLKIVFTTNTPNQDTAVVLQYVFKKVGQTEWVYAYTGGEQTFTVPYNGRYKLETWGAQGGSHSETKHGGYGGYSNGAIYLKKDNTIFINVGGQGVINNTSVGALTNGGYNGGGATFADKSQFLKFGASGGGATHIANKTGLLSTLESYKDTILIVSGGGGGSNYDASEKLSNPGVGGSAGGYIGEKGTSPAQGDILLTNVFARGGTQSAGGQGATYREDIGNNGLNGSFGNGGRSGANCGGGGSGFYGGGGGTRANKDSSGAGGSSYIGNPLLTNKTMYCYNCQESSEESTKTISTTCTSETPTANCAKQGNGYAKITLID